jgi:cobalamin biosynthesis Mg chelatase CobN
LERVNAISSFPPENEHTAVYHVTAELLEMARRGASASDAPPPPTASAADDPSDATFGRTVNLEMTEEMLDQGNRTVTFQVPEDLLEEARRMFETAEHPSGPDDAGMSESTPEDPGVPSASSSQPLVAAVPTGAIRVHKQPSEETTVPSAKKQRAAAATASPASAPRANNGWLWFLIVCLVVALVMSLVNRVRLG